MPTLKAKVIAGCLVVASATVIAPVSGYAAKTAAAKPQIQWNAPASTVVAVVNGEKITKGALDEAIFARYANTTLTDLIDRVGIKQAATKQGVKVTTADLDAKVKEFKTKLPPGMTFSAFLKQWNLTESQLRTELSTNIYVEKAAAQSVKVTDQDLSGYVRARHILVSIKGSTAEERTKSEADAKAKIEQLAKDIKDNKITFAEAAIKNSEDPGSKDKGGDLGFFKKGAMVPEFDAAAFALKVGDISEPVKTTYGYHLIKVEALGKDAAGSERADLLDKIKQERLRPEMTNWYMKTKNAIKVTRYLGEQPTPPAMQAPPRPRTQAPKPSGTKVAPKPAPAHSGAAHEAPAAPPAPPAQ